MDIFTNIRTANVGIKDSGDLGTKCSLIRIRPDPEKEETLLELYDLIQKRRLCKTVLVESEEECVCLWGVIEVLEKAGHTPLLLNQLKNVYEMVSINSRFLSAEFASKEIVRDDVMIQTSHHSWVSMNQWDQRREIEPQHALDPFLLTLLPS